MKRSAYRNISLLMTAIYLLITVSPVSSFAFRSGFHPTTTAVGCSGDCKTCGCSAERSASHTCCCWQKKLALAKKEAADTHKSCPTATIKTGSCCDKHDDHDQDNNAEIKVDNNSAKENETVSITACPCGNGKDLAFSVSENGQHMPFNFTSSTPDRTLTPITSLQPGRLDSRYSEPPDPPPKLVFNS
jgi:hypothetical protein